ncbi:MAG: heme A synthase [Chloroflexia bacterium]|nr:heme A synthase [Chloroflexia bacterium]
MLTLARRLAAVAAVGMLVVLLMGATVTKTGSGMGCGRSWPLCQGRFVPEYAFETLVEYSHRLVTSIEGLLLLAACAAAFRFRRALPELKLLIPLTVFTLLLQSGMGAAAVMWPQTPAVLALHFGISLTALASVTLMAYVLREGPERPPRDDAAVPAAFRRAAGGTLLAITAIAYLGAYVRHSNSSLACTTWPLCNGAVFPGFAGPEGIAFGHRLAALGGVCLITGVWRWARRLDARPDLGRVASVAFGLVLLQAFVGALLAWTRLSFLSTMAHAAVMALLFVAVAELCRRALPRPVGRGAPAGAATSRSRVVPAGD